MSNVPKEARAEIRLALWAYAQHGEPNDAQFIAFLDEYTQQAVGAEESWWLSYLPELAAKVQNIIENYAMTFSGTDIRPAHRDADLLTKTREREKQISAFVGEIIRQRPVPQKLPDKKETPNG